jgi:2-polyprenyl-3-methyl-5-hydroxy-6-metoxy-1,4-benzoquinol methylase
MWSTGAILLKTIFSFVFSARCGYTSYICLGNSHALNTGRANAMFQIGREQFHNKDFCLPQRIYFRLFGAPEIGAKIRAKRIIEAISGLDFAHVLDAGCGKGYMAQHLARKSSSTKVLGIDFDPKKVAANQLIAKQLDLPNLSFKCGDLCKFATESKFDLIIASDVLEHIIDDTKVLENFNQLLASKGWLVLHVPQKTGTFLFRRAAEYVVEDHVRPGYTEEELREKLAKAEFKTISVTHDGTFFESWANQLGNILSTNVPLYALLLPLLTFVAYLPERLSRRQISNTLTVLARRKT